MNWLQSIRHQRSLSVFKSRATKVRFKHSFVDFEAAKNIGFIVNIAEFNAEDLVYFTQYITKLEDKGKGVIVIEINLERKAEPMFRESVRSVFINSTQVNWLQMPSIPTMRAINGFHMDILVNLDHSELMTSRYVSGFCNAVTRVGLHQEGYEDFYELMLQLQPETKIHKVLEQFELYTKMIEK
jgi:hypothetical protein